MRFLSGEKIFVRLQESHLVGSISQTRALLGDKISKWVNATAALAVQADGTSNSWQNHKKAGTNSVQQQGKNVSENY